MHKPDETPPALPHCYYSDHPILNGPDHRRIEPNENNKISKRGSPHVRLILHMLAKSNVYPNRNREYLNPVMRAYFEKKIAEKPYKVVMCAIMRKMVQIIFAVLRNQKSFESH